MAAWLALILAGLALWAGVWSGFMTASSDRAARAGVIDIGFAQHMSQHHDQAIALSDVYLNAGGGALNALARRIQRVQLLELGQMRGWLRLWGESLAPRSRSMDWMLAGQAAPDAALKAYLLDCERAGGMPGLASAAQIQALAQAAEAGERDALFLQLMIRHHQGGLPMLAFAAREAQVSAVQELATRMLADQSREMLVLQRALANRGS